jgi:hypothetical protein
MRPSHRPQQFSPSRSPTTWVVVCTALLVRLVSCSSPDNPFEVAPQISYPDSLIAYPELPVAALTPTLARNVEVDSYTVTPALSRRVWPSTPQQA